MAGHAPPYSDAEWAIIHAAAQEMRRGRPLTRILAKEVREELEGARSVERSMDAVRQVLYRLQREQFPSTYVDWLKRHEEPAIDSGLEGTLDRDRVPLDGKRLPPEFALAVGDMQFGEHQFLLECWEEIGARAVARIREIEPARVRLLLLGDVVTGGGVFRAQELKVALPTVQPQTAYAAGKLLALVGRLRAAPSVESVEVVLVKGNHDTDKQGADIAFELARLLHELGVRVSYGGLRAAVNLAPEGAEPFLLGLEHSSGNSAYYSRSYASIRNLQRYTIQSVVFERYQADDGQVLPVRRWVTGHSHWCQIAQDIGGIKVDTVGGHTRPERYSLGGEMRPMGGLVYVHDGASLVVETCSPAERTVRRSVDDPFLHTTNLADMARVLREVQERYVETGLIAPQGTIL